MSGYTVEQLLRWSLEQKLIEDYFPNEKGGYGIRRSGEAIHLPPDQARKLLISLLREGASARKARR